MANDESPAVYSMPDKVKVNICEDLWIDFHEINL
jgi:hypothetical protein